MWGGILRGLPFENAEPDPSPRASSPESRHRQLRRSGQRFRRLAGAAEELRGPRRLRTEGTVNVSGLQGGPERFQGGFITASAFKLLRVQPLRGRLFTEDDNRPGAPPVAIIGWDIWQNRFGGDTAIIGKTIRANGVVREVVGVMPRKFLFPTNVAILAAEDHGSHGASLG